jgi:hypothetical protein
MAIVALTLLVRGLGTANARLAAASAGCRPAVNDIHWGAINGQPSVTFAGQVQCTHSAQEIELHTVLYFCGSQVPEDNKTWLDANCGPDTNMQTDIPEEAGVTYTLSSPSPSETATSTGYYAAKLNFSIGGSNYGPFFGTPAFCSSGSGGNTCRDVKPAG